MLLYLVPALAVLQAVLMLVDEGYFHRRRGLGTFERYGHVVDSLVFAAALFIPFFWAPSRPAIAAYIVLAISSCLIITKDEWIHAEECGGTEQWCHSLLFILHGALLLSLGLLWVYEPSAWQLKFIPPGALLWAAYQHIYWNVYERSRNQ